jgi:hypothetical protein
VGGFFSGNVYFSEKSRQIRSLRLHPREGGRETLFAVQEWSALRVQGRPANRLVKKSVFKFAAITVAAKTH